AVRPSRARAGERVAPAERRRSQRAARRGGDMSRIGAAAALPDPAAARRAFDRAAATFATASVVHDEARSRLLERLDFFRISPGVVVDLGAGRGDGAARLRERYPGARV